MELAIELHGWLLPRSTYLMEGDKSYFHHCGFWSAAQGGKHGEYYDPVTKTRSLRSGCPVDPILTTDTRGSIAKTIMIGFLLVKTVLYSKQTPAKTMNWFTTNDQGSTTRVGTRGNGVNAMDGNAAMYDAVTGKIFAVGGAVNHDGASATANADSITLGLPKGPPLVTRFGSPYYARDFAIASRSLMARSSSSAK